MSKNRHQRRLPMSSNGPPPPEAGVVNTLVAEVVAPGKPFTPGVAERMAKDPGLEAHGVKPFQNTWDQKPAAPTRPNILGTYPAASEEWWAGAKGT